MLRYGSVIKVSFPEHSYTGAREIEGDRPAIIVQDLVEDLKTIVIIPLTANLKAVTIPFSQRVNPSSNNGLSKISVIVVSQIRAIDRRRVKKVIGQLEDDQISSLKEKIINLLNL